MPYLRAAHEWDWNAQALHISALYMQSNVNPVSGVFQTDGSDGRDLYSDYALRELATNTWGTARVFTEASDQSSAVHNRRRSD